MKVIEVQYYLLCQWSTTPITHEVLLLSHMKYYSYRTCSTTPIFLPLFADFNWSRNYSGRFVVLPHAQLPSLQPTRVNRFFTKYEAVYNVSMLGLSCAINCNSRNGERSCFLAVSMTECITAYASAPRNVRKSPGHLKKRVYSLLQ